VNQYRIEVKPAASKELTKLPKQVAQRIADAIDELADNPRPPGCKKLVGTENTYRIRVGDYRVIYDIEDDRLTVWVIRVRHRKDSYK
jgi:mRNA interferase RelE/StbE